MVQREAENVHPYPGAADVRVHEHFLDDGVAPARPQGLKEGYCTNGAEPPFRFSDDNEPSISISDQVVEYRRHFLRRQRGATKLDQQTADQFHSLRLVGSRSQPDVQQCEGTQRQFSRLSGLGTGPTTAQTLALRRVYSHQIRPV